MFHTLAGKEKPLDLIHHSAIILGLSASDFRHPLSSIFPRPLVPQVSSIVCSLTLCPYGAGVNLL